MWLSPPPPTVCVVGGVGGIGGVGGYWGATTLSSHRCLNEWLKRSYMFYSDITEPVGKSPAPQVVQSIPVLPPGVQVLQRDCPDCPSPRWTVICVVC